MGKAFLVNQGCYLVDTEVRVSQLGLHQFSDKDKHVVIDVCGVGLKDFDITKTQEDDDFDTELRENSVYQFEINVLRGIEVKVSRSDFKNGYVCSCNYNYILAPMRLIAPNEIPRGIGLIDFNKYKFSCELIEDPLHDQSCRVFKLDGLSVIKRPVFRRVPQYQIDNVTARIARRSSEKNQQKILRDIQQRILSHTQ